MRPARLLILGLPLLLGCGEADSTPERFTTAVEKNVLASDDTAPPLTGIAAAALRPPRRRAPAAGLAASFLPYPGSHAGGSAALVSAGGQTRVDVRLSGGRPGIHYHGTIRRGRCQRVGARVASLNSVSADSLGSGRASTDAPVPIDSLAGEPHVLIYGRGGRPETCAFIGPADGSSDGR